MTNLSTKEEKSEVLYAFQLACEHPTATDIIVWTKKYPQHAEDIREYAELLLEHAQRPRNEALQPDEEMLAKGRSEAMSAIFEAEQAVINRDAQVIDDESTIAPDARGGTQATSDMPSGVSFDLLLRNACKPMPVLARDINIDRVVIAEVAAGRVRLPVGKRFVEAVSSALGLEVEYVIAAISQSLRAPRLGQAKAGERPTIGTQPYDEVVASSELMSAEQIKYWLDKPSTWMPGTKSE